MVEYVRVGNLHDGDVIARTIYDEKCNVLLRNGNRLSGAAISTIKRYGYKGVYIINGTNERREDIPIPEPLVDDLIWLQMSGLISDIFDDKDSDPFNSVFSLKRKKLEEKVREIVEKFYSIKANGELLYETDDARHQNTWLYYHSINTCIITIGICIYLGLDKERTYDIALGAIYHDIGKKFLPDSLIDRKDISDDEKMLLRTHAENGFRLFQKINTYSIDTTYSIWFHHEREDGSGYPNGVSGDKIPLGAKIVGLASSYDNMINYNPYNHNPLKQEDALELLSADTRFDTDCVSAMMKFVVPYPVGTRVKLSNGIEGVVLKNVTALPLRPYILCGSKVINLASNDDYRALVITKDLEVS